jgi:hypothetical protein
MWFKKQKEKLQKLEEQEEKKRQVEMKKVQDKINGTKSQEDLDKLDKEMKSANNEIDDEIKDEILSEYLQRKK